jgi:hypothetical protein
LKLNDPERMRTCVQIDNAWQTKWASTDSAHSLVGNRLTGLTLLELCRRLYPGAGQLFEQCRDLSCGTDLTVKHGRQIEFVHASVSVPLQIIRSG